MNQLNRHTSFHNSKQPDVVYSETNTHHKANKKPAMQKSKTAHGNLCVRKRPDLAEVIQSLRESGRGDVADTIASLSGLTVESNAQQKQVKPKAYGSQLYYGKFRNAYMYVNSATASVDDQSKMLHGFMQTLKKSNRKDVLGVIADAELVPITLPKNVVVLAIRVPLHAYLKSKIPKYVEAHSFMKAYLRKPRSDTQHLATQMQASGQTVGSTTTNTMTQASLKAKQNTPKHNVVKGVN